MTTATEALFTPVQYFTALDPYNWQVDNRPLSDLEANEVILSEGIETAFHAGKLNSAALGSTLRALAGNGRMMGAFTVSGSALTANILYSVFTLTANVSGKTVSLVGLQPDLVSFALTAPAAGYKKLHTIAAKYQSPDLDLPYFDSSLALDGSQIATGSLEYEVTSSTVALADAETYPTPGSGFTEVIRIKVLAADTVIDPTNVTYPNFVLEGQAFNYASQTRAGQVLFATAQDITEGTSTNKAVAPADIASIVSGVASVPQASQTAHGTVRYATSAEVIAGTSTDRVVTPADLKGRIDAIPAAASVPYATQSSSGVVIFANTGEITAGTSTDRVVTPANLATKAALAGSSTQTFSVANATATEHAINLGQFETNRVRPGAVIKAQYSEVTGVAMTSPNWQTIMQQTFYCDNYADVRIRVTAHIPFSITNLGGVPTLELVLYETGGGLGTTHDITSCVYHDRDMAGDAMSGVAVLTRELTMSPWSSYPDYILSFIIRSRVSNTTLATATAGPTIDSVPSYCTLLVEQIKT